MPISDVRFTKTDGNIGRETNYLSEQVSGMLFDTSAQADLWSKFPELADKLQDTVVEVNNLDDVEALGLVPYNEEDNAADVFMSGIPYYHIDHFFKVTGGSGRLFLMFADCSKDWSALIDMQKDAGGHISQFGVWTEQSLWRLPTASAETYSLELVQDIQLVLNSLCDNYYAPSCVILSANTAKVKNAASTTDTVLFSKLPSCYEAECPGVALALGQSLDTKVQAMQVSLASKTPVGSMGAAIGALASSPVDTSIGYVGAFNMGNYFPNIEMGFGDATAADGAASIANGTSYNSLTFTQLDKLADLGYVFLRTFMGYSGTYFSSDHTCSNGDYRTIGRNRVINKSIRLARQALLPYVNMSIPVDKSTGRLTAVQASVLQDTVRTALNSMVTAQEISDIANVTVDRTVNLLTSDSIKLSYLLTPRGVAEQIEVTVGLGLV